MPGSVVLPQGTDSSTDGEDADDVFCDATSAASKNFLINHETKKTKKMYLVCLQMKRCFLLLNVSTHS